MRLRDPIPARRGDPELRHADRTLKALLIGLMAVVVLTGLSAAAPSDEGAGQEPLGRTGPAVQEPMVFSGVASWYGESFRGRPTACGEPYDPEAITAAHRTLPCWARVRVQQGDRSIVVTVTDRGPYVGGRHLDLSRAAFARLAPLREGLIDVRVTVLTP